MSDKLLNLKNPLELLGFKKEDILSDGEFGAVLARTGVGKTSIVVQLAIFAMAKGKKVIHISLDEPVNKINVWYREVFNNLAEKNGIDSTASAWESILPNRFIMTLQQDGFTVPRLEERLADLSEQDIFTPDTLIIDGFPFDDSDIQIIEELKAFAEKMNITVWFTVRTHRHESPDENGLPVQMSNIAKFFESAVQIVPEKEKISLKVLIGDAENKKEVKVNPETMLITE